MTQREQHIGFIFMYNCLFFHCVWHCKSTQSLVLPQPHTVCELSVYSGLITPRCVCASGVKQLVLSSENF